MLQLVSNTEMLTMLGLMQKNNRKEIDMKKEEKMNKKELSENIAERTDFKRKEAETVINAVTECIKEALAAGDKVQIAGFGTFEIRQRKARQGRNPRTPNKTVSIAASTAPVFKAGKFLKRIVNEKG